MPDGQGKDRPKIITVKMRENIASQKGNRLENTRAKMKERAPGYGR